MARGQLGTKFKIAMHKHTLQTQQNFIAYQAAYAVLSQPLEYPLLAQHCFMHKIPKMTRGPRDERWACDQLAMALLTAQA